MKTLRHLSMAIRGLLIVVAFLFGLWVEPALADGSGNLVANGGKRALTEWRTNTTAGLYRRTFVRVYAQTGERILMGSSAVGVGSGDIVLYRESQISSSQIAPAALAAITPEFKCSTYRQSHPGAGVLDTRAKELAGPLPATGGYTPCAYTAVETGVYWIAFYGPDGPNGATDGDAGTIDAPNVGTGQRSGVSMWDVTVRNAANTATIPGRVFVDYLAQMTAGNGVSRRVFSTLYAVTTEGFIYKVDMRGLDPNGYIFYGNRVGFLDPDGKTPLYHDLVTNNNQLNNPLGGVILAPATAKLFFAYPANDLPDTLLPTPIQPVIQNVTFEGSASSGTAYYTAGGTFRYSGNVGGIMEVVISRDGVNFEPTAPQNRVIYTPSMVGSNTVVWDGKDNSGNPFPVGTNYPYRVIFHAGEYHFPMLDVENSRLGGPTITLLNPLNGVCPWATCRHAFYDDRGYRVSTGVTIGTPGVVLPGDANAKNPPSVAYSGATGFDTGTTQRAFGDDTGLGFGNWKGLDLWTYIPVEPITGTLDVIPQPGQDLRLTKSHSAPFQISSAGGSFTLQVSNVGTDPVPDPVTVTDTLPSGLTYHQATGTGWSCSVNAQTVTCTHPNTGGLAAGSSLPPITLIVDVAPTAAPGVTNTAQLSNAYDSNATNNQTSDVVNVQSADVRITKTVSQAAPAVGDTLTFTVKAENLGPFDATGVIVNDPLPTGLTLVSAQADQGNYASGVWTVGTLPVGTSATLSLVATVNANQAGQSITNTATRSASSPYDFNSANDTASVTVNVRPTVLTGVVTDAKTGLPIVGASVTVVDANGITWVVTTDGDGRYTVTGLAAGDASITASYAGYQTENTTKTVVAGAINTQNLALKNADLVITKTDGKAATTAGDTLVYTIVVYNDGSLTANGLRITDTLSSGLSFIACSPSCTPGSPIIWDLPAVMLAPGAAYTLTLTVYVQDPLPGGTTAVSNYVRVSTPTPESDITDNEVSDLDPILTAPDLRVTISDGEVPVAPGQPLTYQLTYQNAGNVQATGTVITVTVPEGLDNILPNNSGIYNAVTRTITWTIGALDAGSGGTLSFTAQVAATATPESLLYVPAFIADDGSHGADQDPSNNHDSDTDRVARPQLTLLKQMSGPARLGVPITVTILYTNTSEVRADNVTIEDTLPAGASYVADSCTGGLTCNFGGGKVTWTLGSVARGSGGTLTFQMLLDASAGGATAAPPSLGHAGAGGSVRVLSAPTADAIKVRWQGATPTGPAGWNANPRQGAFDESAWGAPVAASIEPYWYDASEDKHPATWITLNTDGQIDPNYTFYRVKACVPPNADGLTTYLDLAGDDVAEIYLNGVPVGQQIGAGSMVNFQPAGAAQGGLNLLAVRLLNNRHGGHALYGGADHIGLLFDLTLNWTRTRSFVRVPRIALAGETLTFAVDTAAVSGVAPLSYRFEFGDGAVEDYTTSGSVNHTYATPGTYQARVYVRDAAGCTGYEDLTLTILPASAALTNLVANPVSAAYDGPYAGSYTTSGGAAIDFPLVDLAVSKTTSAATLRAGEPLTYTLVVTHRGGRTLDSLTLTDPLPESFIVSRYVPSSGSYDPNTGAWTGITLAAGQSLTLTIVGEVSPWATASSTLNNTATVNSDTASETAVADNTATASVTLTRAADLGVSVSGVQDRNLITFTVVITHYGPSGLTSFNLSDVFPSELKNPVYIPSVGTYDPDTDTWSDLVFLQGDVLVLTVVGTLPWNSPKYTLVYPVTVSTPADTPDPVDTNNTAQTTLESSPTAVHLRRFVERPSLVLWPLACWVGLGFLGFSVYRRRRR